MLTEELQELSSDEYALFRDLVYRATGISLGPHKQQLVRNRLGQRMRAGGFTSYRAYYEFVRTQDSGHELTCLIDAISTNTTQLFRERQHFAFLAQVVSDWCAGPRPRPAPLRIWSAGCSSGEEAYSIAMTIEDLRRRLPHLIYKLLATDISTRMLQQAGAGIYSHERLSHVPRAFLRRYFVHPAQDCDAPSMQVIPQLRAAIRFACLNLVRDAFPFENRFDVIFCRNVMIYFDNPTQQRLVANFHRLLNPGGYLLIGHAESLSTIHHDFTYVKPTTYQRP